MQKIPINSSAKKTSGFSLIELSIALIIIGLIVAPLFTYLNLYYQEKARAETLENLQSAGAALAQYFTEKVTTRAPRPPMLARLTHPPALKANAAQRKNQAFLHQHVGTASAQPAVTMTTIKPV